MVASLLIAEDPRLGLLAITGMFKGRSLPADRVTPKMFDLVESIIENRNESWWGTEYAVKALNRTEADRKFPMIATAPRAKSSPSFLLFKKD